LLDCETVVGWDLAYRAQLAGHDGPIPEYLWTEQPVPFLQDAAIYRVLRKRCSGAILDAGCGDGRNALHLERYGFYVIGVDISPVAVEIAARRAQKEGQNRVVFMQDDIRNLRTRGPVDAVLCVDALSQVQNPQDCLGEFYRVLRPGGLLLFNLYTPEDGTYGAGRQIGIRTFEYKSTLFKYYLAEEVSALVGGWKDVQIHTVVWMEPPHGEFRPLPHTHVSHVVLAEKPE
jgi:SAM-dependent methyltransferase